MKKKTQIIKIRGLLIAYSSNLITIYNSFTIINEKAKYEICKEILNKIKDFNTERTLESLVNEWEVHNLFWNLGLFKKHTIDCDLESEQSKFYTILYKYLSIIARKVNKRWQKKKY